MTELEQLKAENAELLAKLQDPERHELQLAVSSMTIAAEEVFFKWMFTLVGAFVTGIVCSYVVAHTEFED